MWISAACAVAALAIYGLLPACVPNAWVAEAVATSLQDALGRRVTIEHVDWSYADGLALRGVHVDRRAGFGQGAFFTADQITAPWPGSWIGTSYYLASLLAGSAWPPLETLHADAPQLWVVTSEDGHLNIEGQEAPRLGSLPAYDFALTAAALHVVDLRRGADTFETLRVPHFSLNLDPRTGDVSWSSEDFDASAPTNVDTAGRLSVPRLLPAVAPGGAGTLRWRDLELAALRPFLGGRWGDLDGRCNGVFHVTVQDELAIDADVDLAFPQLRIGKEMIVAGQGVTSLKFHLHWDPATGATRMDDIRVDVPGTLRTAADGHDPDMLVMLPDQREGSARLELLDLDRVARLSRLLDVPIPAGQFSGNGLLTAGTTYSNGTEAIAVQFTGTSQSVVSPWWLQRQLEQAEFAFEVERQDGAAWVLRSARLRAGDQQLAVNGRVILNDDDWTQAVADEGNLRRVTASSSDLATFRQCYPFLDAVLPPVHGQGPVRANLEFDPATPHRWTLQFDVAANAKLCLQTACIEPTEDPIEIEFSGSQRSLDAIRVQATYGPALLQSDELSCAVASGHRRVLSAMGNFAITDLEAWIDAVPKLQHLRPQGDVAALGDVGADIYFETDAWDGGDNLRVHVDIDIQNLEVSLQPHFAKPGGTPGRAALTHAAGADSSNATTLMLQIPGGRLDFEVFDSPDGTTTAGTIRLSDIDQWLRFWPTVHAAAQAAAPQGAGRIDFSGGGIYGLEHVRADLTGCALHHSHFYKPAQDPLVLEIGGLRWDEDALLSWAEVHSVLGRSHANLSAGRIVVGQDERVVEARLSGSGHLDLEDLFKRWSGTRMMLKRSASAGTVEVEFDVTRSDIATEATVRIDAGQLQVGHPLMTKQKSHPLDITVDLRQPRAADRVIVGLEVGVAAPGLWMGIFGAAQAEDFAQLVLDPALEIEGRVVMSDGDGLPVAARVFESPRGALAVNGAFKRSTRGNWSFMPSALRAEEFTATVAGVAVRLHGAATSWDTLLLPDGLDFEVGRTQGRLFRSRDSRLTAWLRDVDPDQLQAAVAALSQLTTDSQVALPPAALAAFEEIDVLFDRLHIQGERPGVTYSLTDGRGQVELRRSGEAMVQLQAAFEGGTVDLKYGHDGLRSIRFEDVMPTPAASRRLALALPGLDPRGPIHCHWAPVDAGPRDSVRWRGMLRIDGGEMRGKAAPAWVTRVFPGLNLAHFRFDRMHDWFDVHEDGRVWHNAVFQGKFHHLYAAGWEGVDGVVEYEVGIDLLAAAQSRYWATNDVGRIPLFVSKWTVAPDGQVDDQAVQYIPVRLARSLIWGVNPLTTAYHAVRKRVLGEE